MGPIGEVLGGGIAPDLKPLEDLIARLLREVVQSARPSRAAFPASCTRRKARKSRDMGVIGEALGGGVAPELKPPDSLFVRCLELFFSSSAFSPPRPLPARVNLSSPPISRSTGRRLTPRPLDNGPSTGKVNAPDSDLSMQTNAVTVPADSLPQDNALASNQPDVNTPGSIAQELPPVVPTPTASVVTDGPSVPPATVVTDGPGAPAPASTPGLLASTDLAANNPTPMASVPSKTSAAAPAPAPAPTTNATVNLINLMVKRNLISRDDADGLIRQAQQEADNARATQAHHAGHG